ncbi:ABC transporter substrate-binding protein [Cohnella sp. CIP 111063]|jgi:ABC-type sugar transport system, periplasmic component|uniref:ABC transporter substrate-binding protein n=1 Tax=unclassified Cohnella TaxID=2636738 RepID=UPI000B8C25E8|nr:MULTISPECIES: sugar ABC transporter substrate-binding protein [unclassified Cohnella]OXS59288.1 ABC transporter substrate-binding protein [Cohnella sp. CIP 111063]PRX72311.1 carbohydrate ABC transporter substrate-binding protein (CUT1 family) [Cohnella sp. SGD-V74]
MKAGKRLGGVLLAAVLAIGAAGCGNSENNEKSAAPTGGESSKAPENTSSPTKKVKITYSMWGSAEEGNTTQAVADKFNASQDRIEVEVMAIPWENYMTKLNTLATANQLPDTGMLREDGVIQWSSQGMLNDVGSMYEGSDSKPLDSLAYKYQGKTVAYAAANEILLLYYNKDMFDKAGVPYPPSALDQAWTWDEFVAAAKKLTIDKNGKHPGEDGFDSQSIVQYGASVENLPWQLETWAISNGGGFYNNDGTEVRIGENASVEAIQKVADLYLKDHVAPLSVGQTDDGIQRTVIAGTVAMATNGQWNVGTSLNTAKEQGLNYGVAVLPYMNEKVTLNTGGANVVFSQTKHPEEAMEWLKWYTSEENNWGLISSGIWMPVLEKWYTDETLTRKWVENPNFPPYDEYKSAVVDYAQSSAARPASWFYTNHTTEFNTLLGSILGDVWTGKTTAADAISKNLEALKAAHSGSQ